MMGGPIDARRSPTAVNNLATNKRYSWFEHNVIHRVPPNYPGAGRRVYPGFMQHSGFVAMNPRPPPAARTTTTSCDLIRGDGDNAECASRVLRRVQRRARHAGRVLPRHHQDGVPGLRAASTAPGRSTASWCVRRTSRRRALLTIEGELDDISGAGQTAGGARPVHRHPDRDALPLRRRGRRPLRHLLRPALAREGLSGNRASSSASTTSRRPARTWSAVWPKPATRRTMARATTRRATTARATGQLTSPAAVNRVEGDAGCRSGGRPAGRCTGSSTRRCRRRSAVAAATTTAWPTPRRSSTAPPSTAARRVAPPASHGWPG